VQLRQARRRGRLVGLLAVATAAVGLPACGAHSDLPDPRSRVAEASSVEGLRVILDDIAERSDVDALQARARAFEKLRALGGGNPPNLVAEGDAADLALLAKPAGREEKAESAARIARHFRERGENPALCKSSFAGALAEPLRRFVLASIAASFGEYASRKEHSLALERMASLAADLADRGELRPALRDAWHRRARLFGLRAVELASDPSPAEPSAEALKFCEFDLARHLDEATAAADRGTTERASRGDPDRALEWYLQALSHFTLVRESVVSPTTAQAQALGAQEIVVLSVTDLLCRPP
jgi:hypothetical protein